MMGGKEKKGRGGDKIKHCSLKCLILSKNCSKLRVKMICYIRQHAVESVVFERLEVVIFNVFNQNCELK